jgi:hypothetical protein
MRDAVLPQSNNFLGKGGTMKKMFNETDQLRKQRMKKWFVLSWCAVMLLGAVAPAELLVYEGFDFAELTPGVQITGLSGATSFGFAEPFRMNSGAGAAESARFVADSLVEGTGTLRTRDGSIQQTVNNSRLYRNFNQVIGAENGTYYISFLMSAGQNIALDLSNGDWNNNVKASIGTGDTTTGGVRLTVGTSASAELAPRNEVHFYVVKLVLTSETDTVSIFVDPDPMASEPAPNASFSTTNFSIDRIRFGKYNSNTNSAFDEFRLGTTFEDVTPGNGAAYAVSPQDGQLGVPVSSLLQWQVGDDPNELGGMKPWNAVAGYYVYTGSGTDPNLYLKTPTALPAATTSFAPALAMDTTYYWQIEETFDNGQGGVFAPGDPNNVLGPVWMFQTILTVPVITVDPVAKLRVAENGTAEISVVVESASPPAYMWYRSADAAVGSDSPVGSNSPTLTLHNVQLADEGYYYCVVTNSSGLTDTSTLCNLRLNRLLSWYRFENNLDDSAGSNHAVPTGKAMNYVAGVVSADAQTYAADPNGTNYGALPANAYPKAGFANGLDQFTYTAWVKLANNTQGGALLGEFNLNSNTCIRFAVNTVDGKVSSYIRQEGGTAASVSINNVPIDNNEWHFVAVTYSGTQLKGYYDGVKKSTTDRVLTNFANWQYQPFPILAINSRGTMDVLFKGSVDDLKIYNYPLTEDEMALTYYNVTGKQPCVYGNPAMDFSGNCIVDFADFVIFSAAWLEDGFYPVN